jgi:sarcosine oxidase, subunit gamma
MNTNAANAAQVAPERANPMFAEQDALRPQWTVVESMKVVSRFGADDARLAQQVGIGDRSAMRRCGFKGPGTVAWLEQQGVPIPPQANSWRPLDGSASTSTASGLVARLGRTEFLIEDAPGGARCAQLLALAAPEGVYSVLRQDAELVLVGRQALGLLLQTCSGDFASLDLAARPAVLTSMVGVGVTVVPELTLGAVSYRIWCDGSFAPYLWETLVDVARDLGGGPIGLEALSQR